MNLGISRYPNVWSDTDCSSLLIQAMIQKAQLPDVDGTPLLSFEEFKALAGITYDQLSSLRHRGAISTVTTTFENCCRMTQHKAIKSAGGDELLNQWFEVSLLLRFRRAESSYTL
jgi:hypothetical protein